MWAVLWACGWGGFHTGTNAQQKQSHYNKIKAIIGDDDGLRSIDTSFTGLRSSKSKLDDDDDETKTQKPTPWSFPTLLPTVSPSKSPSPSPTFAPTPSPTNVTLLPTPAPLTSQYVRGVQNWATKMLTQSTKGTNTAPPFDPNSYCELYSNSCK